jgi:hypothetical protein
MSGSTSAQHIQFSGSLTNGQTNSTVPPFAVLAQDNLAPTVTDGFAIWNIVSRPQRVAFTVLSGYNPVVMTVPIMFDALSDDPLTSWSAPTEASRAAGVERAIQQLEWMAGRGKLYASDGNVGAPAQGDSPIVSVSSTNGAGVETNLIPPNCRDLEWVITGLDYDTSPLRNANADRVRQLVTVTVTQHVGAPGTSFDSPAVRAKGRAAATGYTYYTITAKDNTIRKIMTFRAKNPALSAARTVLSLNKTQLHFSRSVDADLTKVLHLGDKIKVPNNLINPKK